MPVSAEVALSLLLQGLTGRTLAVQHGTGFRPILTSTHLLLPTGNNTRAATAHAAAHLLYSPHAQPANDLKPIALAVIATLEDARVELLLQEALPGVRHWFLPQLRAAVQPHGLDLPAWLSRLALALADADYMDRSHWVTKARALFAGTRARHSLHGYAAFRRIASVLANDLGQMRVRFEPQQQLVPAAYRDDHSYLWQHGATTDDVTELTVPLPTPGSGATHPSDSHDETTWNYPEWDYRLQRERADWCTLRELAPSIQPPGFSTMSTGKLRLRRAQRLDSAFRLRRQWEGEELDLDAAIEATLDHRLGRSVDSRVFRRPGRSALTGSVLVLLDLSASTLDPAPGADLTLLELERQAALLLARSSRAGGDRIAVHGFSSDTRERVRYLRLLDFDAPLDAAAQARIASAPGEGSTRMGPALRHATCLLAQQPAPRTLLLVTDGSPSDIDIHDSRYLGADAQAAVQAAQRMGIRTYAIKVGDGKADTDDALRHIVGAQQLRRVWTPAQLPAQLVRLYRQLPAG
jgi:nitric oxide reductase NorD protein